MRNKVNWSAVVDIVERKRGKVTLSDIRSCGVSEGNAIEWIIRFAQMTDSQMDRFISICKEKGEQK